MALTQIHLPSMRRLIEDVRTVSDDAVAQHQELSGLLTDADLSASDAAPVQAAAHWLAAQVPMLRRRLALAEEVEASTPGIQVSVRIDESQLTDLSPEEAEALAEQLAEQISEGPHTQELADQLAEHAGDPYFATAMLDALSPEELADYLGSVDFEAPRTGQADLDYARRHGGIVSGLRLALQTAARSGDLPEGYAEGLAEVIMTGEGSDALALADFLSGTDGLHADVAGPTRDALQVIEGYRELVDEGVLTELLAGGEPSTNAWRRDANSWTFDTWFGNGDIKLVLADGAALASTPEGIFMTVGDSDVLVTSTDLFAHEAGTMWGEIFMVNDESADPAARLRQIVEAGTTDPPTSDHPLWRVLRHEEVHAQQWARYGHSGFIARYLWHNPFDPCNHPFEEEAGFEDGGYFQCVS